MAYFDQAGQYAPDWTNWNAYIKDRRYNRHSIVGPGIYLNSMSNALFQMRYSRRPSPSGHFADGVCGYSYAVPSDDGASRATFLAALTSTNVSSLYDPSPVPLFLDPASTPVMPWKSSPTRGHLKGFVFNGTNGAGFDGAAVTLTGPTNRTLLTDAGGFYGAVDLPLGSYMVSAGFPGFMSRNTNLTVTAGMVTSRDLTLLPPVPSALSNIVVVAGARSAIITWQSTNAASSQVDYGFTTNQGTLTPHDSHLVTSHSMLLPGLVPNTNYFFAVISRSGTNTFRSDGGSFSTAGEIILDDTNATFTGSWNTGTVSSDKLGSSYRYVTSNTNGSTASALYTPTIITRGYYDVFVWYPEGGNRSTNVPVSILFNGGLITTRVNQETNGGRWVQVGTNLNFAPGANGIVRISNGTGDGDQVMADGVRLVYRAEQDTPGAPTVPDWWTFYYFGSTGNPAADNDGDGYPAWGEYLLGTIPTNAASRLDFRMVNEGNLRATFSPYFPDRLYQLQKGLGTGQWLTLTNLAVTVNSNAQAFFNLPDTDGTMDVYRLKVNWPSN